MTDEARTLELASGRLELGLSGPARAALGASALAGLVACALAIAVGAAASPSFLIPSSRAGFPAWLGGPLSGLGEGLTGSGFSVLVAVMCVCYATALACASAVRARWALAGVMALHLVFMLAPPLLTTDVFGYIDYARLGAVHGLDPYSKGAQAVPSDPVYPYVLWHHLPSPYGPLFTLLSYGLAPLGVGASLWTIKGAAAATGLGCVALVWACARRLGRPPLPAALFVGLNPLWLVYGIGGAHNDLLMALLVVVAVLLSLAGRERLGAAALVAAAAVKVTAGLLLPFMALGTRRSARVVAGGLAGAVAVGALALAVFGVEGLLGFVSALGHQQELSSAHSVPHYVGVLLGGEGVDPQVKASAGGVPLALRAGAAAAFAAAAVALLIRVRRGADWIGGAAWATLALLLTSLWLMPWYVVWLLPLAALGRGSAIRVAALGLTAFIALTRLPLFFG